MRGEPAYLVKGGYEQKKAEAAYGITDNAVSISSMKPAAGSQDYQQRSCTKKRGTWVHHNCLERAVAGRALKKK